MTKRIIGVAALLASSLLATSVIASDLRDTPGDKEETKATANEAKPDEDKAEAPTQVEKPEAKEKTICRRVRLDASSRRATKVCKTSEEWRKFNQRR
ncbi:MAG: hypothetical protein ABJP70_10750 [Erythrobacter sp.]